MKIEQYSPAFYAEDGSLITVRPVDSKNPFLAVTITWDKGEASLQKTLYIHFDGTVTDQGIHIHTKEVEEAV